MTTTTTRLRIVLSAVAALAAAGCLEEAPADPTWSGEVWPILRTNCIRCHGADPIGGAPPAVQMRLVSAAEAARWAPLIAERAGRVGDMPPGGPELNQYQRDVLINWADGMQAFGAAGQAPVITATVSQSGDEVTVSYTITDPDRDLVEGVLLLDGVEVARGLHGGAGSLTFDVSGFAPGSYMLEALLDDLSGDQATPFPGVDPGTAIGMVTVAHANTAPAAAITWPFANWAFTDADPPADVMLCGGADQCVVVQLRECRNSCTAPDGAESYSADVVAVRGSEQVVLASDAPLVVGSNPIAIDQAALAEGTWTIRVVVGDGAGETVTEVGPVYIGHRTATTTGAQAFQFLTTYCQPCHTSQGGPFGAVPISKWFVDGDQAATLAVVAEPNIFSPDGSYRGQVLERVITYRTMPPVGAKTLLGIPQPTQAERDAFLDWMLAGGPQ